MKTPTLEIIKKVTKRYNCLKCPAYCCSYERIDVTQRDIVRLAKHHGVTPEQALRRFTKIKEGDRVLRHQQDTIYKSICMFIDQETRRCTIYEARPAVCRQYPEGNRCGYYDFISWERRHQDDQDFVPLAKNL